MAVVAVIPREGRDRRPRLFDALERALDLRLEGRDSGDVEGCAGVILLDGGLPPRGMPALVVGGEGSAAGPVQLADDPLLDVRLRGALLEEEQASPLVDAPPGATPLARREGRPVWAARDEIQWSAAPPAELGADEVLLERLRAARSLELLAFLHFLRGLMGVPPARTALRATFLFDDPNLHWRTYGYVPYQWLVRHADEHGYHAAMAMVPLDAWFAHRPTARLFRERGDRLSLLVHGNNHVKRELALPDEHELVAQAAQALRRIEQFERRSRVPVSRVMAAPHGAAGEEAMSALLRTGFEALCITRPYPWLKRPPADAVLAGWRPAELVAGGFPVLPRLPLRSARRELALRAYLGQPLILFGHHDDLAEGLDPLAELAAAVNRLGDVRWGSLEEIVRANTETQLVDSTMQVRMHTRRAHVDVPPGVERLEVLVPRAHGTIVDEPIRIGAKELLLEAGAERDWRTAIAPASQGRIEIVLSRPDAVNAWSAKRPSPRRSARLRRTAAEARDRLLPVISAARRRKTD